MLLPLNKYPSLDLHGETKDTVFTLVDNFIKDNIKLRNEVIVLIHGKGEGILKEEVHAILRQDKRVKHFYLHYWNQGATVVEIKI